MTYDQMRGAIQNGDLVFFSKGRQNIVRKLICWFTRGETYHVGIAFWLSSGTTRRLMLAESQPDGFRIINLGFYADRTMEVFDCPVDYQRVRQHAEAPVRGIQYDFLDLAMIGVHERFGVPLPARLARAGDVCSGVVARILNSAGAGFQTLVSPCRLRSELIRRGARPRLTIDPKKSKFLW